MKKKYSEHAIGILAGVASALFVTGYLTVNKFIYSQYPISALDYSIVFALAGGLFGLLSLVKDLNKKNITAIRKELFPLIILGIVGTLSVGIFVFGQQFTTTVNAALLMTSTIVATSLFSFILLKDKLSKRQWIWTVVLFTGLYIGIVGFNSVNLRTGDLIILGSVLLFGFGNAFSRSIMQRMEKPGLVPDIRIVIGGIIATILGIFILRDYTTLIALLPLALVAGLFYYFCMKAFAKAVHLLTANEAIILNNSQIFFTSITGVLLLSESYSVEKFIGSLLAIISIYFITARNSSGK